MVDGEQPDWVKGWVRFEACGFGSGGRFLRWRSALFGFQQIWNLVRMIRVDNAHTAVVCVMRRRHHGNHYQNRHPGG